MELNVWYAALQKGCAFWYWEEEYIDILISRNVLDVGPLVATDENSDDAISKIEEEEKHPDKSKNLAIDHKEMEEVLVGLVGAINEVVFLLKCVIFLVIFFGSILLSKNWWSYELPNK